MASAHQLKPLPPIHRLISSCDWTASPLGPRELWPSGLRTMVDMLLRAEAEIVLFWGPEFVALYNDAYAPTIGDKHPHALGRPAREHWAELWDDLEPLLRRVRDTGETFSARDREFYIERHGFGEQVFFDVSYSAVPEADGTIGGVLCIVTETTGRVLAARRLAESERRFRALVNATSDIVFRMSADWSNLIHLDGKDLLADVHSPSLDWTDNFIPEDDRPHVTQAAATAIARNAVFECEHRVFLKNGEIGWVQSRAVPIVGEDGAISEWFGAASDITAPRQQRERLEVVVHELDHRVKNTLAMVQAIALQTFREGTPLPQAQDIFAHRLKAIADANALLTGDKGVGASLRHAIEQAVHAHCPSPDRLVLAGEDLTVTPKTALAVSLAMHELATNALKYGAWSSPSGTICVQWLTRQGDGWFDLTMQWIETGGPPVAEPARRGFGSKLIERGLAAELNGKVTLSFAPEGARCTMQARLPITRTAA